MNWRKKYYGITAEGRHREGMTEQDHQREKYGTNHAQVTAPSYIWIWFGVITVIHDVSTGRRPYPAVDQEEEYPEHVVWLWSNLF